MGSLIHRALCQRLCGELQGGLMVTRLTRERVWYAKPGAFDVDGCFTLWAGALQSDQGESFDHASSREDDPRCDSADQPGSVRRNDCHDRCEQDEDPHRSGGAADAPPTSPRLDGHERLGRLEPKKGDTPGSANQAVRIGGVGVVGQVGAGVRRGEPD